MHPFGLPPILASTMTTRHLILGFDGADLELIRELGAETLPHLHAQMRAGAFAALRSAMPPATLPNWTTFLTGGDPGQHGVFDFAERRDYGVHFVGGTRRAMPTLWSRLDRLGMRCASIGFPATWPPEELGQGYFISGWDSPVAFEADASYVWPPDLHSEIERRFGILRFDEFDQFRADARGWHAALGDNLVRRIEARCALACWLLDRKEWDFFAFYFGESDTAAHHLWSLHDPNSPRRPAQVDPAEGKALAAVYRALDAALGKLLAHAGGSGVELTLVSDHGSGGASDKVLYLNRWLQEAGFLHFREATSLPLVQGLKHAALSYLPPRWRERIFRFRDRALANRLESMSRFGAIDMAQSEVFSDELNYFPALHLNLRGRESLGRVAPEERWTIAARLREACGRLRDPWTGKAVVRALHTRESLFVGEHIERAPDFLLELELDAGYSYNLMPSASAPRGTGAWRKLGPEEYLGRKGRSLPGSHRPRGLFLASGPSVAPVGEIDAAIADASATLLARAGIALPEDLSGRVLWEALRETTSAEALALPAAEQRRARSEGDPARLEERLRLLGYMD